MFFPWCSCQKHEQYAVLNDSTILSLLDYSSGYHHITLSPKVKKKSPFVTLIGKAEPKILHFGLAQVPTHFQKIISPLPKCLPFAFGYLGDILIFSENTKKHLEHLRAVFD